jgi:hypothetical protein
MQLQHLTQTNFASVVNACRIREAEYVTLPSGIIERAPTSTQASHQQAYQGVLNALNALSDEAVIELQALAWFGRGDSGSDLQTNLQYSKQRFDATTREYLYAMSPLRRYIEAGLANSGAVLAS